MERFQIPQDYWPYTIEASFSAMLRRRAVAEGAYSLSEELIFDYYRNPKASRRAFVAIRTLSERDDAYFYLMAPSRSSKMRFAEWIAGVNCLTRQDFSAFDLMFSNLKQLLQNRSLARRILPNGTLRSP